MLFYFVKPLSHTLLCYFQNVSPRAITLIPTINLYDSGVSSGWYMFILNRETSRWVSQFSFEFGNRVTLKLIWNNPNTIIPLCLLSLRVVPVSSSLFHCWVFDTWFDNPIFHHFLHKAHPKNAVFPQFHVTPEDGLISRNICCSLLVFHSCVTRLEVSLLSCPFNLLNTGKSVDRSFFPEGCPTGWSRPNQNEL